MEIFLGAEIEGPATSKWFDLQKEFSELLVELKDENYGDSLTSIGIITILRRNSGDFSFLLLHFLLLTGVI